MRVALSASLLAAGLLAATFGRSSAQAQSTTTSYRYCLLTDEAQVCAYNSVAQCMAARRGNADFCEPNNVYTGDTPHASHSRM